MSRVHAYLVPAAQTAFSSLPAVAHNGTLYVVSEPGTEWHLHVRVLNPKKNQLYRVQVLLDGQSVGYSKTCHSSSSAVPAKTVLEGFTHTALDGTISYTAFKFGSLKPAAGAATVQHVNEIRAGRVDVMVDGVVKVGESVPYPVHDVRWSDYGAAGKQLPEGKKWFLQPGLKAEQGSTVTKTGCKWCYDKYETVFKLPMFQLRYDTAENLLLRKILDPSKPEHRAILSTSKDQRIAAMGRRGEQQRSTARQPKQEQRTAGVKRERDQRRQQQQQQQQLEEDDGQLAVPRSATAETINLIDEAPLPRLTVHGQALQPDEMAVCDLCDSDDEPDWQVKRKQAVEVSIV